MTGCTSTWMPASRRLSSMLTESTRNGMSSLTMSIAVCGDCQPCCSNVGLYTRTSAVPAARSRPNVQCDSAAP